MHIFLQRNLLRPMRHLDVGDPVFMSSGPMRLAAVAVSVPEQKSQQDLARNSERLNGILPATAPGLSWLHLLLSERRLRLALPSGAT